MKTVEHASYELCPEDEAWIRQTVAEAPEPTEDELTWLRRLVNGAQRNA